MQSSYDAACRRGSDREHEANLYGYFIDELNEEIAYQALSIGAEESEINFPDTLKVKSDSSG